MKKLFLFIVSTVIICILSACSKANESTDDPSGNTNNVALTGNANPGVTYVNIDGTVNLSLITINYNNLEMGAEVSTEMSFLNPIRKTTNQLEGNKIKVQIKNLTSNTKYYYRIFVKVSGITYVGETHNFTTQKLVNLVSTGDISDITSTSAIIATPLKDSNLSLDESLSIFIAYSSSEKDLTSGGSYNEIPIFISDAKSDIITNEIRNLIPGTKYYYCAFTSDGVSQIWDEIKSFTTLSNDNNAEVQQAVLIEDFTGQACVNCPVATSTIHKIQETYGEDNVIAVAIHSGPFAHQRSNIANAFLSDLGTPLGDEYYTHWGIEAQPGVKINRGAPIYDTNQFATAVANELKKTSTVRFDAVEFSNNSVLVNFSSSVHVEGRLQVWIVEDSINAKDPQTKYQQYMPDGSRCQDYVHNHVFRASLTNDAYGEPITLEAGNKSYTQVFNLQGNEALDNFEHLWQKQNLSAVVFFWNEKQGVMQAIRVKFNTSKSTVVEED